MDHEIDYKETTFFGMSKIFGWKIIINWSFFWALLLTILFVVFSLLNCAFFEFFFNLSKYLSGNLLGASAGVLGIVIAALTITLTLFHQSLLPIMLEKKLLHKFLFPFWFASSLWGLNIVLCFFLVVFEVASYPEVVASTFVVEMLIFLYATFYTIKLTGLVIRLALQRAQFK